MDTVDDVLAVLEPEQLGRLNITLMQVLLAEKTLRPFRLHGEWYRVVIDGTQVMTVQEGHCPHCLHRDTDEWERRSMSTRWSPPNGSVPRASACRSRASG